MITWKIVVLEIVGGKTPGTIECPHYHECFRAIQAHNIKEAVSSFHERFKTLFPRCKQTSFDPLFREFPDIDFSSLIKGKEYCFFALYPDNEWRTRAEVRVARRKRADELNKTYKRPEETKGFETLPEKVKNKIFIHKEGCWLWVGKVHKSLKELYARSYSKGKHSQYGSISIDGKSWSAHRYVYTVLVGEIPEWGILLHSCDNRKCVSPHHLTVGLQVHNVDDMVAKGRARFHKKYKPKR